MKWNEFIKTNNKNGELNADFYEVTYIYYYIYDEDEDTKKYSKYPLHTFTSLSYRFSNLEKVKDFIFPDYLAGVS